ncbi:hypothetical protein P7C71_g4605, partial [Lecanoromycetidae sp. Uapishka_2]
MPFDPRRPIEVHVCYAHERGDSYPHWLLSVQSPGASKCTWIHSTGGPSQNRPYERSIQAEKPVKSRGIASTSLLGVVPLNDYNKVLAAAKRIEPQQCQMFVVAVVAELEKKALLPEGSTGYLKDKVQMSKQSTDYRRGHPVAKPAIAYTQKDRDGFYGRN